MIQIVNPYIEISLARSKNYKNRIQGPIFPFVKQAIVNSITNLWPLRISYEGDNEISAGSRVVHPFLWGKSKFTGNDLLRAYQVSGTSTTDIVGFKTFRLDRIRTCNPFTTKHFGDRILYNPDDMDMNNIILAAKFN